MKKTMRLFSIAALAIGLAAVSSCSKDDSLEKEAPQPAAAEELTVKDNIVTLTSTVGFDEASTRALTAEGVKTFAAGEKIAVIYKNESNETVKAESQALTAGNITNGGKNAAFTVTLTNPKASGAVRYIYPAAMAAETVETSTETTADATINYAALSSQEGTLDDLSSKYDLAVFDGELTAETQLPASATLANQLSILAITLKNADGSKEITSTITGMTLSDGTYSYSVERSAAAGPIYVAVRPTSSATIDITATDGTKNYTKTLTSKTYAASNGYNVSWRMTESASNVLSGEFSVSSTKKVKFSKGNLRYASSKWSFFDNQYDYYSSYSADAWDHFGWSTSATTYGMNTSTDNSDYSGDFVDWGSNSDLQTALGTGWFTLTSDEWTYLFNTRSASTVGNTENGRYAKAKVNNVNGVILFPDTYTHPDGVTVPTNVNTATASLASNTYTVADWTKMESAGCVFLPAASSRNGSESGLGSGYYWSATPYDAVKAYNMFCGPDYLTPAFKNSRFLGFSVRLVKEVDAPAPANPKLGDLFYSDGTFSTELEAGKTPIGVIAYLDQPGTDDDEITEKSQGAGHGLVLCLKNAASGADAQWSTEKSAFEFGEDAKVGNVEGLKRTTNVSGYTNTKTLAEKTNAATNYKAAYAAKNYAGLTAPTGTTGWFLPSAQQWVKMQTGLGALEESSITWDISFDNNHEGADKWEAALSKAGSGNYDSMTSDNLYYWSSSEYSASNAVNLNVCAMGTGYGYGFSWYYNAKGDTNSYYRVRPVLAF